MKYETILKLMESSCYTDVEIALTYVLGNNMMDIFESLPWVLLGEGDGRYRELHLKCEFPYVKWFRVKNETYVIESYCIWKRLLYDNRSYADMERAYHKFI